MSSDLNYEYAKAYQKYLLKEAERNRLANLAQSTRNGLDGPLLSLLPKAWDFMLAWRTKLAQRSSNGSQPLEQSQCCDMICEACS